MIVIFSINYKKLRKKIKQNSIGKSRRKLVNCIILLAIIFLWTINVRYRWSVYVIPLTQIIRVYSLAMLPMFIAAGLLLGFIILQYSKEAEIAWLLSLPITYKEIAKVKIDIILSGVIKFLLAICITVIPWGVKSREAIIHWINSTICIIGLLLVGITLGVLLVVFLSLLIQKICLVYIICFMLGAVLLYVGFDVKSAYDLLQNDKALLVINVCALILFFCFRHMIYKAFARRIQIVNYMDDAIEKGNRNSKKQELTVKKEWLFVAILKKECRYYKRELQYIMQFVVLLVVLTFLIVQKAQDESAYLLAAYILLYTMPFNLCGLVSVYSFGAEYSLIQTIYAVRREVLTYYLAKVLLPFIICFLPMTIIYFIYTIVSGQFFLVEVWLQLQILLLYYAAFGTATSCVYLKADENNLVLTRGIKISGTVLYYITGLAFPILLAFHQEGMLDKLPMIFNVYGLIQLFYSIMIIIVSPIYLRKRIVS